jgi:DNA-directed RNA polymerase subunit K/omega
LDYDGDELNVWNPRNFEVLSELEYILDVNNCIISTETGNPSMSLVINSKTAGYLVSHPNIEIEASLYNDMVESLLNKDSLPTLEERMNQFGFEPFRIDENGTKFYYSRTIISTLFPVDFRYDYKGVHVYNGILIEGILNSAHLGKGARSIVDELAKYYGHDRAADFLTDAPHALNLWIVARGFTVGRKDCVNMVIDSKCEIYNKKYNKRAKLFEYELNRIRPDVFKNKTFDDLPDVLDKMNIAINQTMSKSIDLEMNQLLKNELEQLSTITTIYKPLNKCTQKVNYQNAFILLRLLNQDKSSFKNKLSQILDNITLIFKVNNNQTVNDLTFRLLKAITHQLENGFILSGQWVDLNYFYDQLLVDNNATNISNIDDYILSIFNIAKDVDYDLQLQFVVDVLIKLNNNYKQSLNDTIIKLINELRLFKNCIDPNNKTINNIILLIFNEQLLIITSSLFTNLQNELSKEYNKNILIKNEELAKIYLDIDAIGSKKNIEAEQLLHHERLITEKTDVVKAIGAKIIKTDLTNSIILQTEAGSGTKGSVVNVGQIMGSVGQQYVSGQRLWNQFPRLSSHFDVDDESPPARGMIESSYNEGLSPTELFYVQGSSKVNVIETAMLTPTVGKLQRLAARSLENVMIAGDGSLRNANGLMYASSYNAGFDITKTLKVTTSDNVTLSHFIDIGKEIDMLNNKQGWYTQKELKSTPLKLKPQLSLEQQFNILTKKKLIEEPITIHSPETTTRKLTIYEKARIIGVRAEMLNNNATPRVDIGNVMNPLKIAQMEYEQGKLAEEPALFINRTIPGQKEPIRVYPTLDNI